MIPFTRTVSLLARPVSLLALATLTACGSVPMRSFEFDAISIDEQPRPALIVVNDDWVGAAERKQFVNVDGDDVLTIPISFQSPEVEITIAPVKMVGGQPNVPKSRKEARDASGFMDEVRKVMLTDPKRVLFILPKKNPGS